MPVPEKFPSEEERPLAENDESSETPRDSPSDEADIRETDITKYNLVYEHINKISNKAPKNEEEFYNESFDIFSKLDQLRKTNLSSTMITPNRILSDREKSKVAQYASKYTDLLRDYYYQLGQKNECDEHEIQHVNDVLRIWSLSEILYFSGPQDEPIVTHLSDWLSVYWPLEDGVDGNVMFKCENDDHDEDWKTVYRYLLRNNIPEAVDLLEIFTDHVSQIRQTCTRRIIELLQAMPMSTSDTVTTEDISEWKEWHANVLATYRDFAQMTSDENDESFIASLLLVLQILSGDKDTILEFGTYLESLVGLLVYNQPFRTRHDIALVASKLHLDEEDSVAAACHHLITRNWDEAFEALDDHWFQTHLGHLLITSGYLLDSETQVSEDEVTVDPVYYVISAYAECIAERYSMWKEAVVYMNVCKANAEIWIAKVIAKREDAEGDVYNATLNYARAEDITSLEAIANRILKQYLKIGVLDGIVSESDKTQFLLKCPSYAFLLHYDQLRKQIEAKEFDVAAKLLMRLITSLTAPEEFRTVLLVDSFCIQQASRKVVFDRTETSELIDQYELALSNKTQYDLFGPYFKQVKTTSKGITEVVVAQIRERLAYNQAIAMA
ncbi:Nuclear pore complex protein Nup85 [Apophysomyces sp. BC1021]|nr:Nuclear pore complex protein Nup85 [Apophysomyces sp. BC1021]